MQKTYIYQISLLFLMIVIIITWLGYQRIYDFKQYHTHIASTSSNSVSEEVTRFVIEKKRLIDVFVAENFETVKSFMDDTDNETYHNLIDEKLRNYFPAYFTFTIADKDGFPLYEDFDGLIGDACITDLQNYADSGSQNPRIHPNVEVYHFDVLAPFKVGDELFIFFVSFDADILAPVLKAAETPQHQIYLVHPEFSDLIEVTSNGSRILMKDRLDFRLQESERQRILYRTNVKESSWDVIDMHAPGLFEQHLKSLLLEAGIIITFILFFSGFALYKLYRTEKARQTAERHKEEFLSAVSHELRTPITSISGALQLVINGVTGKIEDKTKELLMIADKNSVRLGALVNDLLDVQKIEAGKMEFDFKDHELVELVSEAVKANEQFGNRYEVKYKFTPPNEIIMVQADSFRLQQVITNLLSNAAKYGPSQDTVDITIELRDIFARINITDHGKGVSAEFRPRLFEKFAQEDGTNSRKIGGTGLGLNIAKHLVESHGGQIGYEFSPQSGSTFYIEIPLTK